MTKKENVANQSFEEMLNSNPALSFISTGAEYYPLPQDKAPQQNITAEAPEDDPDDRSMFPETKSKRVQLLLRPSVHAKIKTMARRKGLSFNDYVNKILAQVAEGENDK